MEIEDEIFIVAKEAISINKAVIIENNDSYMTIEDKIAKIFYICLNDNNIDIYPLISLAKEYENTVAVLTRQDVILKPLKEFSRCLKVKQFIYKGEKFVIDTSYKIVPVTNDDLSYIKDHYYRIGDDDNYLKEAIFRGMIKAVDKDSSIMGFIGEHPEHAIGMLYIDEKYRRKGIGKTLEKAIINKFIDEGKIPFDHVVIDNNISMSLQASLGLELTKGIIYWYF